MSVADTFLRRIGFDAVLMNTAIANTDRILMAEAMQHAVLADRQGVIKTMLREALDRRYRAQQAREAH